MNKDLKKLKTLGAQKIHEDTHIALSYVQSMLHASFEGLTQVQFLGFVSILEREYNLDLSTLKARGMSYFAEEQSDEKKVFIAPEKKPNFTALYVVIVLIIFSLAVYVSYDYKQETESEKTINNHTIEDVQKKILVKEEKAPLVVVAEQNLTVERVEQNVSSDINSSRETNTSDEENTSIKNVSEKKIAVVEKAPVVEKKEPALQVTPLIIKPRTRVWIGYINRTDHKKRQAIVTKILTLDGNKEWLLALGHGNVNIVLNGNTKRYASPQSIRFLYKNGKLKKLSIAEFKKLNNGRLW